MVYRASSLRGLAVAQMIFGALMIIFGIASVAAVHHWSSYVGFGIWVGIWVLITGILGYIGAKDDVNPNKCLIGCFMGFSIPICVVTGIMFICYCVSLAQFNEILKCRRTGWDYWEHSGYYTNTFCYSSRERHWAAVGAGIGSCMLIFTIVEFFLALASSIYCCNAVCCNTQAVVGTTVSTQQVTYIQQPQHTFAGGQGGVVIIQPSGAVTTTHGYPVVGQQPMYYAQQPVPMQQPAYWAVPSGSNPAGVVTVPYAGAAASQVQNPGQVQQPQKDAERPPPYAYMQTDNVPPPP
ncbi:uncharacterized protein LOC144665748 [Oculina patagonica]